VHQESILELQRHHKANQEQAKKSHRVTSPASLLVDFGYTFGRLIEILDEQARTFLGKDKLLGELKSFNRDRRQSVVTFKSSDE
jgi:hypothetical protein